MKVSNFIIYIMKIMWRDFKKIRSGRFGDIQESAKDEVALIQVVRKRVSFQDRKNENTPKFPSIEIWY